MASTRSSIRAAVPGINFGMTNLTKIIILSALDALLLPTPALADLTLTVTGRKDNSQALQPADTNSDTEIDVNRLDCLENIDLDFNIEETDAISGTLYLVAGSDCTDQSNNDGDGCIFIKNVSTGGTVKKNLRTLLEVKDIVEQDDCDDDSGSVSVWAARLDDIADRSNNDEEDWSSAVTINWDMAAPNTPEGLSAQPGDSKVVVKWNADDVTDAGTTTAGLDDDVTEVRVIYLSGSTVTGDAGQAESETDSTTVSECPTDGFQEGGTYVNDDYDEKSTTSPHGGSLTITSLANYQTYKFAAVALDEYNNPSKISETVCMAPGETSDFFTNYKEAGGNGGKFCFVATAAFGSYDHPVVKVLRRFRDNFLAPMPGGQALIDAYYRKGPAMAAIVAERPMLKSVVQGLLVVFAGATVPFSALGPLYSFLLGLALVVGVVVYKRR